MKYQKVMPPRSTAGLSGAGVIVFNLVIIVIGCEFRAWAIERSWQICAVSLLPS